METTSDEKGERILLQFKASHNVSYPAAGYKTDIGLSENSRAPELERLDHRADPLEPPLVPFCVVHFLLIRDRRDDEEGGPLEENDFGGGGEGKEVGEMRSEGGKGGHEVRHDN